MSTPPDRNPLSAASESDGPRRWWRSSWRNRILWLVALAVAAAAGYGYLASRSDAQAPQPAGKRGERNGGRPLPVVAQPAKTEDVPVHLDGLGTVVPLNVVTVRPRVDGQLMAVRFKEGQMVKAGDVLAEIDPRPFQVQLDQAQGQLAKDEALLKNARIDLERYRTLFQQDSIAKQQLDTQAALVRQYESTLKVDRAQVDSAKLQLTYARVTAPIGGRVGLRQVDAGNIVRASDTAGLVVITQTQPASVVFPIPQDNLPAVLQKLRKGERLRVDALDRDGKTQLATGWLLTADNQLDATTGTVKLKAQFPNEDERLFPNQFVNARLQVEVRRGATVIPAAAVQRGTQGDYVYVVKTDATVTVRPVTLGPRERGRVAVENGLAPGEVVVVDGADKLREGAAVDVAG
ncbi:MAG: MdtA/MuxA family multidrug efflux RND transporter periplasmic adaptor subunit, partial [Rhodocyclaceae bacterium]